MPYYGNGTATSQGTGYASGSGIVTGITSQAREINSTTYLTETITSYVTAARNVSGCTINALANLIYWDTSTYNYALTTCASTNSLGSFLPLTSVEKPTASGVGSHGVAATRTVMYDYPGASIVRESDYIIRETQKLTTYTQTDTFDAYTFIRSSSLFVRKSSSDTPYLTEAPTTEIHPASTETETGTIQAYTLTYTSRSVSLTTPPWAGPSDVLQPNITYSGDVYDYTVYG